MEGVNPCHCGCLFPTITRHAAVSPTRPPRPQQGSATLHRSNHAVSHAPRTKWISLHRISTATPPFTEDSLQTNTCKNLSPLATIKGEVGYPFRGPRKPQDKITHTHIQTTDSAPHRSNEYYSVHFSKPRLGT